MKTCLYLPALSAAILVSAPAAEAAKPAKPDRTNNCRAAAAISVEHGVTVYRARPRPWHQAIKPEPAKAPTPRILVRPYRHNYLSVDTRPRGEWGVVNAVYQKF